MINMNRNKDNKNVTGEKTTKKRIFEAAINLFAQKGFDTASMREIAETVGIKKASLYSHYKSKEEIIDCVFQYFKEELVKMRPPEVKNLEKIDKLTPEIFRQRANLTLNLFKNPKMEKIFRILLNEQFRDERAKIIVLEYLIQEPYCFSKKVLEIMVNKGIIAKIDPEIKAMEFQYPIFTLFLEYLLLKSDGSDTTKTEKLIERHVDCFVNTLKKGQ
jgi:AcrR family transcriptional regulator